MKISASEAAQKMNALKMIPTNGLEQGTRIKVLHGRVRCSQIKVDFDKDGAEALNEIKPENFDEHLRKYGDPDKYEGEKDADFEAFKDEYNKVSAEYNKLYESLGNEAKYEAELPAFTDVDFVNIGKVLPSEGNTTIGGNEVPNDEILCYIMSVL